MKTTEIFAAVETVSYRLAPSAIDALGLARDEACEVFAAALGELFESADVTVRPNDLDASTMTAEGEVNGAAFALAESFPGRRTMSCDPLLFEGSVVGAVERALDHEMGRVWDRAIELAAERLDDA